MSYQFKGIDIANIVDTYSNPETTNFANVYQGLPNITPPQYNSSYLLTNLGYTDANGTDLSTVCAAAQYKYNTSGTIIVPTGANQFRYFIIGGSGGGGGGGGCANNDGWQQSGGSGGNGGFGYTYIGKGNCSGGDNMVITIGTGGTGGGGGNAAWGNESGTTAVSNGGASGNSGNTTTISYGNWTANASGGTGGGGGGWAGAYRSNFYKNYRLGGWNGQGYTQQFDPTNTPDWNPYYVTPQWGGGGGKGGYNISMGGAWGGGGQDGYAVIVWLYD